jgi:hypothetical protein
MNGEDVCKLCRHSIKDNSKRHGQCELPDGAREPCKLRNHQFRALLMFRTWLDKELRSIALEENPKERLIELLNRIDAPPGPPPEGGG